MNKVLLSILILLSGNTLALENETVSALASFCSKLAISYGVFLGYNYMSAAIHEASHNTAYHLMYDKTDSRKLDHSKIKLNTTLMGTEGITNAPIAKPSPGKHAFMYGAGPIGSMVFNGLTLCISTHPLVRAAAIADTVVHSKNLFDINTSETDGFYAFRCLTGRKPTPLEQNMCRFAIYGIVMPASLYASVKYA